MSKYSRESTRNRNILNKIVYTTFFEFIYAGSSICFFLLLAYLFGTNYLESLPISSQQIVVLMFLASGIIAFICTMLDRIDGLIDELNKMK